MLFKGLFLRTVIQRLVFTDCVIQRLSVFTDCVIQRVVFMNLVGERFVCIDCVIRRNFNLLVFLVCVQSVLVCLLGGGGGGGGGVSVCVAL